MIQKSTINYWTHKNRPKKNRCKMTKTLKMNPKMSKGKIKINHLWFKITKIEHKWKCIMSRRTPKKMPVCQKWCRITQTKCQIPKTRFTAVKMRHKRINIVQHKLTLGRHNEIKCNPKWLKLNLWKMTTSSRRFKRKAKLSKLHKNIWLKQQKWNAKRLKRPIISKIRCQITTKTPKVAKNYQI